MILHMSPQCSGLRAQRKRLSRTKCRKCLFQAVVSLSDRHKIQYCTVVRRKVGRRYWPPYQIALAIGHYSSTPNGTKATLAEREVRVHPFPFDFWRTGHSAIGKVRTIH